MEQLAHCSLASGQLWPCSDPASHVRLSQNPTGRAVPSCERGHNTQVREELYQTLGALAGQVSSFYAASAAAPAWAAALAGDLPSMRDAHVRLLMRHVLRPLIKACPPAHRYFPSTTPRYVEAKQPTRFSGFGLHKCLFILCCKQHFRPIRPVLVVHTCFLLQKRAKNGGKCIAVMCVHAGRSGCCLFWRRCCRTCWRAWAARGARSSPPQVPVTSRQNQQDTCISHQHATRMCLHYQIAQIDRAGLSCALACSTFQPAS